MIMNEMKTNAGKYLAAVLAMALAIVGCAVVLSDGVNAETTVDTEPIINGTTVTVYDAADIRDVIAGIGTDKNEYESITTIVLANDIDADSVITVNKPVTIDGNGYTITANNVTWSGDGTKNLVSIQYVDGAVTLRDITIDSAGYAYGINTFDAADVSIIGVTAINSVGAGLTVDASTVEVSDSVMNGNGWGDINVDNGSTFSIDTDSELTSGFQIWSEDVNAAEGASTIEAPNYVKYRWDKESENVFNGAVYFKNGIATGLQSNNKDVITIASGQYLVSVGSELKSPYIANNGTVIQMPEGVDVTYSNGVFNVTGTPVAVNDATYKELFDSANSLYAYAGILGLTGSDVAVKQVNPALSEAWSATEFPNDTKEGTGYDFNSDSSLYFLIPKNGGDVTITLTPSGEGAQATEYKFNFQASKGAAVVNDKADLAQAMEDFDEITIGDSVKLGTNEAYTVPAGKTLNLSIESLPTTTTLSTGVVLNLGDITTAVSKTFAFGNGDDVASIALNGFTGDNISVKQGSVEIAGTNLSGKITVTGDVVITELADQSTGSSTDGLELVSSNSDLKTVTYEDDLTVGGDGLTIGDANAPVSLEAESNQNIVLNGNITIKAGSALTVNSITGTGTINVAAGATLAYTEVSDSVTIKPADGAIIKIEGGQGTENIISSDMTVTGDVYLSQDTTINEGVTVTVTRNSTLHLMSFDLINNGNIVVERNGTIVSDNDGEIRMMSTGTIQNNGIIGGTKAVTIVNGASPALKQSVSIQGVDGISFKMVRTGTGADRVYNMYVSGDVGRVSGATVYKLTLNNVGINADMSVGSNVALTIKGTVVVMNDVAFTFDGTYMDVSGGSFYLLDGANAAINAPMNGKISVQTGKVVSGNNLDANAITATVDLGGTKSGDVINGVTGVTVSVDRINVYNETSEETEVFQQMYLNGTAAVSNNSKAQSPSATLAVTGTAYVVDTLNISEGVTVTGFFDVDAAGTIVVNDKAIDTGLTYSGARYVVETTENASTVETTYYTTFANAMAAIATAQDATVFISGTYEITGTFTLTADQVIEAEGANQIAVGETGDITVELDADIQDTAFYKIYGKVLVKEGIGYTPSANGNIYAVKAVDSETNDTTYSGFGVAMDEAQAGQTITVVGAAEYDGNLVIPNGVTVDVQQDVPLKVLGNVTVENGGKLILDSGADMTVGKTAGRDYTVTVAGELDASEGGAVIGLAGASVDFYSTGTSTFPIGAANFTNVDVNAAYYDDADRVYTTLAAAVAYAETNALPTVYAVGTFSETGAIESDEVDIVIGLNSNVTLGDVTLNDAKISVSKPAAGNTADKAGQYTASVSGLSGAGDAAVTSTVSVSKTNATIESKVTLNAEGVNQYVLTISGLKGATTITAGTVQFADGAELSISRDNALTIASGATLLVAEDEDLTISIVKADPSNAGYFVNNGAIQLDGSLILSAASATIDDAVLPGTVNVSETGAIDANGNVTVTGDVTIATDGKFNVAGILSVGEAPDYLGEAATGSVAGVITLDGTGDDNYVVVYAGASVADAVIGKDNSTEPETTAFQVNGLDLMTVYTFGNETLDTFQATICGLDDLEGYTYDTSGQPSGYVDLVWTAEGNTVPGATGIGEYAIVSTELAYRSADIVISVGTHITVTVDGIIVDNYYGYPLKIGTHTVSATVDPGYSGDVTITFNGQTVSNGGTIEITSEMLSTLDSIVLSVTGSLTQDSTVVVDGGSSGDSGMGLTDYLLIILVILIVVMAIMVAMRLMRS